MAQIVYENRLAKIHDPSAQYGVTSFIYIRGTREGYQEAKPVYDRYIQSTNVKTRIQQQAQGMLGRYLTARKEALSLVNSGQRLTFSDEDIIRMQEQWVEALTEGLSQSTGNFSETTALTMKKIQQAITALGENPDKKQLDEIDRLVAKLELQYNSLSAIDKENLRGLIEKDHLIEGNIVNIEKGAIVLSRLRGTINRLKQKTRNVSSNIRTTNMEFGAIGEVLDTFALNQAMQIIDSQMGKNFNNLKVQQVGSRQVRDPDGRSGTGTTDALFTYEASHNGQNVLFDFGVSLKTTGTVIDESGKWAPKEKPAEIKIKSINAKYKLWNQILTSLGAKSYAMQNSIANTLVWTNASSNSYKIIAKSLLASFFEKYLAGGGRLASSTGIDIADAIMVNGVPIPVVWVISRVVEQIQSSDFLTKNKSIAFIDIDTDNPWEGGRNPNVIDAMKRSTKVFNSLKRNLSATVKLNGNQIYTLARLT